jgi:hypothetical protein
MNNEISLVAVQPFDRSLQSASNGNFDVHLPVIEVDDLAAAYPELIYVGPELYTVQFNLYTAKPEIFNSDTMMFRPGVQVATDAAHADLLGAPFKGLSCVECGLRMVVAGRLDAFVFDVAQIDPQMIEEGLSDQLFSIPFKVFPVRAVARPEVADQAENWLTTGVSALRQQGLYRKLLQAGSDTFREVQDR